MQTPHAFLTQRPNIWERVTLNQGLSICVSKHLVTSTTHQGRPALLRNSTGMFHIKVSFNFNVDLCATFLIIETKSQSISEQLVNKITYQGIPLQGCSPSKSQASLMLTLMWPFYLWNQVMVKLLCEYYNASECCHNNTYW